MISIILLTQVSSVYTDIFQILILNILLHVALAYYIRVKYGYNIMERNQLLLKINTVNIITPSLILNTSGSNIERATNTSLALPLFSAYSGTRPCSTQLITSLQTSSFSCSSAISAVLHCTCCISFTTHSNLITGSSIS